MDSTLVYCHPHQNNWFIVIHIKTIIIQWIYHCFSQPSNQMDSKQLSQLVYCHPYQNNWFIVIHIKTIGSLSSISKNWFIVIHTKTSVTQWIHHCFIHDSYMIHTSSNDIPCTITYLDHTSKEQVSILQFSCYSHSSNFHAQAQHEEANTNT